MLCSIGPRPGSQSELRALRRGGAIAICDLGAHFVSSPPLRRQTAHQHACSVIIAQYGLGEMQLRRGRPAAALIPSLLFLFLPLLSLLMTIISTFLPAFLILSDLRTNQEGQVADDVSYLSW